ncbi:solute carrier family 22 member 15-like [Symsagittifera roscoffensis]|uniref:solute carrier family 22 member 15-like n=1 Tax=Symsagittifera roscoffensis TaxID=84072 RepID=UPI00307C576C
MEAESPLEQSLQTVGMFGRAQFIIILVGVIVQIYIGWPSIVSVFVAIDVDFQCVNDTLDDANITKFDNECVNGCEYYVYRSTPSSMVSDFDLACGNGPTLVSTANSAFWAGFMLSCLFMGTLADMFGRRTVSLFTCFIYCIASSLLPFIQNIYEFIAMRFVCGMFHYPLTCVVFILVAEWVDKEKFGKIGMSTAVVFGLGEALAALMGYLLRDSWRIQLGAMTCFLVLVLILIFFFLPESAKWLYQTGHIHECEKVMRKVSRINGTNFHGMIHSETNSDHRPITNGSQHDSSADEMSNIFVSRSEPSSPVSYHYDASEKLIPTLDPQVIKASTTIEEKEKPNVKALFGTRSSCFLMLTNLFTFFSSCMVYFGLAFGVSSISGNIYFNSALLALVELPAWFVVLSMDYVGRKPTLLFCLLVCSIACTCIPITNQYVPSLSIVIAMVGKLLATGAFDLLFVYIPEQSPTVLRTTGLSICSGAARIGTIIGPYVIQAGSISDYIPYGFFALCGYISFVLCVFFQVETLNRGMPQTIEQYYLLVQNKRRLRIEEPTSDDDCDRDI